MLKKILASIGIILFMGIAFLLYTFWSTGFFRKIEPKNEFGEVFQTINLPGVEDLAISRKDSFLILSVDDRAKKRDGEEGIHDLYWLDLSKTPFQPQRIPLPSDLTLFPHGISLFELGPHHYQLAVINHVKGKHSVELFSIQEGAVQHERTLRDPLLISPNDLVLVGKDQFYYSNDHGNTSRLGIFAENYLGVAVANVGYFDGENFRIVAEGMGYPNGLQYDSDKDLLFVASSRKFLIRVFDINSNGDLSQIEDIDAGTGVDNIELDEAGNLWIGSHPDLMTFSAYAAGKKELAPSEIIKVTYQQGERSPIEKVWIDSGETMSASSVAVLFGDFLFLGNVMDQKMLVLKKSSP
ncbi:SMP-30/gluconolactonase/LRE family protein [Algoriphagus sp. CAU 1675]|uniref:SMP-30/gluconolactonase/LRE family protein n=1 Tax=Algoriphagus sp. CAU 1675 TaxID=3032597 RepID=UPI0023DB51C1|nr:SMP-30/gluconolactonase/LRE family protein [Algoriphagus sp. CAU 1675]MDF2158859.1 SMP-30/gluconolactonase/LRE family protein [Algoriphagus sp. CAU 1675]